MGILLGVSGSNGRGYDQEKSFSHFGGRISSHYDVFALVEVTNSENQDRRLPRID
jgi:hypothetical protein